MGKFFVYLLIAFLVNIESVKAQLQFPEIESEFDCPKPILSRLQTHVVQKGETIKTIANQYALIPETIISLNPNLATQPLTLGQKIAIPPFNGIKVQVPKGVQWLDVAKAYGVRQDVLFEVNGCVKNPEIVFIPGLNWGGKIQQDKNYQGLTYYPLSEFRPVGLNYGWQQKGNKKFFHSGVDLLTDLSNSVFAVDDGIVVFVGQEPEYGLLIVINHTNGRQTRYAHLSRVNVTIEDSVIGGSLIGQVGNSGNPDLAESHLHFEVRVQTPQGWITQDPILNLPQN